MRNLSLWSDLIRSRVSAFEAGKALGLEPDRYGRCACPVHHGKDRNCKLWKDNRGFYCWVCRKGGDVIRLVERVNGCTYPEAVVWLNDTFRIGLDLDQVDNEKASERAAWVKEWREFCQEQDGRTDRLQYAVYLDAGQNLNRLERDKEQYRPFRADEEWDERFVNALRYMTEYREMGEEAAVNVIGVKE